MEKTRCGVLNTISAGTAQGFAYRGHVAHFDGYHVAVFDVRGLRVEIPCGKTEPQDFVSPKVSDHFGGSRTRQAGLFTAAIESEPEDEPEE